MRDYCRHEATTRMAYGRMTWVVRVIGNWRMRSELKRLQSLSDYQLRDIGLSQADLVFLFTRPLTADWVWELERHKFLRNEKN